MRHVATHHSLPTGPNVPYAIVGPKCSAPTDLIATIASRHTSAVQVSYGVVDPVFSDVNSYSYFYRTVPSYIKYVEPIAAILEHFDWKIIGTVIQTDKSYFSLTVEALVDIFSTKHNSTKYNLLTTLSLHDHFHLKGRKLQENVRIFVALVEEKYKADTLCAAFKSGLTGSGFVWILLGDYVEGWRRSLHVLNCTEEEMLLAVESTLILTNSVQVMHNKFNSIRKQNQSVFWEDFRAHLKVSTGLDFDKKCTLRVLQAYDAVWSIADALKLTLREEKHIIQQPVNRSITYQGHLESTQQVKTLHKALNKNMKKNSFRATSGEIKFTNESNSPQSPITLICQMQKGTIVPVGIHTKEQNISDLDFTFYGNNLSWQGEGPPRDRPVLVFQVVELWIIVIMLILTALGIAYAMVILIVNCVYRKHKVIKASSPYINILLITGCILGFLIIPVLSIENLDTDHVLPEIVYLIFCNIRTWMINISLTLAFGALIVKTWRVYVVFKNPWARARPYKDRNLLCMVGVLLLFDIIRLSISSWRTLFKLIVVIVPSSNAYFTKDAYRICQVGNDSEYEFHLEPLLWLCSNIGFKLMLLLLGIYLVFKTRKIKQKYFQDARYIGSAMYATVISCGLGVPFSLGLMYILQEDIGFVITATTILFCSFFILSVIFLPRFTLLRKYKKKVPTAVLFELNPSFPLRRPSQIQLSALEKRKCKVESPSKMSAVTVTTLLSPDTDGTGLGGFNDTEWEPAYEDNPLALSSNCPEDGKCRT